LMHSFISNFDTLPMLPMVNVSNDEKGLLLICTIIQ